MKQREWMTIPGADCELEIERDRDGRLRAMRIAGREYLRVDDGVCTYDGGFVVTSEVETPSGLLRHVRTRDLSWVEAYLRDENGLPVLVDGVRIARDEQGRIVSCDGPDARWRYRYDGAHLAEISGPGFTRTIVRDDSGRPVAAGRESLHQAIEYLDDSRTDVSPLPVGWHTDEQGRLWTVARPDGSIQSLFLWEGFHCLARMDGGPGEALSAVFSLDGTGTPVRVITREGVVRVPRDAYGEGLRAHRGVPGLFGGAQHDGLFHYRSRVLDPAIASFDAPDPWHGGADDPRRGHGYAGTLLVERPVAGQYAVCGYDPVGFVDPTGTIAWYYLLSTLTWAFPNNVLTWVGIELTINFWFSLFGGEIDRYFTGAHIHSERFDIGAFQLDGFFGVDGQVFTTQHIVWAPREQFENHAVVSGFVPAVPVSPTYYGTTLRVVPDSSSVVFLLRGSRSGLADTGQLEWARGGGKAVAFAPGLPSPVFPEGGFHFTILADFETGFPTLNILGPKAAVLTELEPGEASATGTLDNRLVLTVNRTGLSLAEDDVMLVTNAANNADIVTVLSAVEADGKTAIRLSSKTLAAGTTGLRLRGLGSMQSSESLIRGADNSHLNVTATSAQYRRNDALRLLDGAAVAGSALVTGFESRLNIDAPLDAAMRGPIGVFTLAPSGPVRGAELTAVSTVLTFAADPVPASGDFITVTRGGTTVAVVVTSNGPNRDRSVDRSLSGLGAAGPVSWQMQIRGGDLGTRAGNAEAASELTYVPIVRGSAPGAGFIGAEAAGGTLAARAVTGIVHDVMVLATPLPGATAQYTVERYVPEAPDESGLTASDQLVLALNEDLPAGVALRLLQLGSASLGPAVGASLNTGFSIAGRVASQAFASPAGQQIDVSDAVVIRNGAADEIGIVKTIEMTLELDRDMTLDASGLRLVTLAGAGPSYDSGLISGREVVVLPAVGGNRVQMPRFFAGEIVEVRGAGTPTRLFRIAAVEGTRLTLEGDADIAAGATGLTAQRMLPVDPDTGGPFAGIEGTPVNKAADGSTRSVRFRFWNNRAIASLSNLGIVSGGKTLPAIVSQTAYNATQPNAAGNAMQLTVLPSAGNPAVPAAPPQFLVGETVLIRWNAPAASLGRFTVTAVGGAVIDVAPVSGGTSIVGAVTAITVRRLPVLDVTFASTPAATGSNVEMLLLNVAASALVPAFERESGNAVTFAVGASGLASPSPNLVVAIPFVETAVLAAGELTSGKVKAPDDPEHWEFDRRGALVEHELRHTQQYNWFGPIWFAAFPMWILDTVLAATTDIELPAFSAFVAATLARNADANTITVSIPSPGDIHFEDGDTIQIYKGSEHAEVTLRNGSGALFQVEGEVRIAAGDVFVRRRASGQGLFSDVALGILRFGTPGSVMNLAMTLTWGTAFQFFGRIGYLISRAVNNGTLLDATVENSGMSAKLLDATKRGLLANEQRVIVQVGDKTVVRSIEGPIAEDGTVTFRSVLPATSGSAKVSPYATHTPGTYWHWNNYYPAIVDPARLASMTLQPVGDDHLSLAPRDRVRVLYDENDSFGFTTTVTAVNGNQIDLEQAMPSLPALPAGELIVRLAKIGRDDPTGWLDQRLVDDLYDAGWVRYLTDPFTQIHLTTQQHARGSFWDYFTRVGRYLLGSSAWSALPAFGWLMWDRVFRKDYLSIIEQDASVHSGDLYSSIGKLRGQAAVDDGAEATMTVGDIGEYWFWPANRWIVLPRFAAGVGDAPGVNLPNELIAMPFITAESGADAPDNGAEPNNNAEAGAFTPGTLEPGSALADAFFLKNPADPRDTALTGPRAFDVDVRGWVPMEPAIQRTAASYLAFSQPTSGDQRHRMTIRNGFARPANDRHAQDEGRQTLFYNIKVDDVIVRINGVTLAEGATARLLQTQRARIVVTPNNDRRYRATVLRPADDPSLQRPEDLLLQARTANTPAAEAVEISRFYHFDTANGQYETGGLRGRGVHLPTDIDVAVRQLNVAVVSTLPVVSALPAAPDFGVYTATGADLNAGSAVFVLVAANVLVPNNPTIVYDAAAPAGTVDPVIALTDANAGASANLKRFLGDGRPFRLALAADDPPEQKARVRFSLLIGEPGNQTTLEALVPIRGHFVTTAPGGAFTIPRGGTLVLSCADLAGAAVTPLANISVTLPDGTSPPLAGTDPELTFSVSGSQLTITANAAASIGRRRLLLTDAANAANRARRTVQIV